MLQLTGARKSIILYTVGTPGEADDAVRIDVRYDCMREHDDDDIPFDVDLAPTHFKPTRYP